MLCLSPYLFSQRAAKVGSLPSCAVLRLPGRRHPRPSWRLYSYAWQRSMVSEYKVSQKRGILVQMAMKPNVKSLECFWNYLNQSSESSVSQKHDLHRSSDSDVSRQARANIRCVYLFVLGSGSSPALSFIIRDAGAGEGGDTGQVRQPPWMICKNCIDLTFHPVGALVIILKYLQLKIWFFGFRCKYLSYLWNLHSYI